MEPRQIDYISAHGTATEVNDPIETQAIKTTFGDLAYSIPISSIKSMIGHAIGAAGALAAATCVNVINRGMIPPTINLETSRSEVRSRLRAQSGAPADRPGSDVQLVRVRRAELRFDLQTLR